jgi:hypothetical protein
VKPNNLRRIHRLVKITIGCLFDVLSQVIDGIAFREMENPRARAQQPPSSASVTSKMISLGAASLLMTQRYGPSRFNAILLGFHAAPL